MKYFWKLKQKMLNILSTTKEHAEMKVFTMFAIATIKKAQLSLSMCSWWKDNLRPLIGMNKNQVEKIKTCKFGKSNCWEDLSLHLLQKNNCTSFYHFFLKINFVLMKFLNSWLFTNNFFLGFEKLVSRKMLWKIRFFQTWSNFWRDFGSNVAVNARANPPQFRHFFDFFFLSRKHRELCK